tara:strand:- start:9403 stop:9567 length:165 start_codon:yes stop_codon:yes gene_type:complete
MEDGQEMLKVWGVNGSTFGVVSFTDIEMALKLILLILSISYTVLKIISVTGTKK